MHKQTPTKVEGFKWAFKRGPNSYQGRITRQGKKYTKTFRTPEAAENWAANIAFNIRRGVGSGKHDNHFNVGALKQNKS